MKKNKLKNELTLPQKLIVYLILFLIAVVMAVPMWNVIVVSTSTKLAASQSGIKLWWDTFSLEGYAYD